jgi:cytochrome c
MKRGSVLLLSKILPSLLLVMLGACRQEPKSPVPGGDSQRGKEAIARYGCTACHQIPGVKGPRGMVGPPLDHMASRSVIGGKFPNNPQTMIKWLQNPPAFDPQASMPNLGVTPNDSRDITAYLYTIK